MKSELVRELGRGLEKVVRKLDDKHYLKTKAEGFEIIRSQERGGGRRTVLALIYIKEDGLDGRFLKDVKPIQDYLHQFSHAHGIPLGKLAYSIN